MDPHRDFEKKALRAGSEDALCPSKASDHPGDNDGNHFQKARQ